MKARPLFIAFLGAALLGASMLAAAADEPPSDEAKAKDSQPDESKEKDAQSGKLKTIPDGCIFSSNINDWTVLDDQRLIVYAPSRKTPYVVELTRPAHGLGFEVQLGFEDHDRDGRLCSFGGDSVVVSGTLRDRISIRNIRRVSPDDAKQLIVEAKEAKDAARSQNKLPPQEPMKSDKKPPPDKPQ